MTMAKRASKTSPVPSVPSVPSASFDYSALVLSAGLNSEDTAFLEDCAVGVECGLKLTVEGIIEVGRALCAARDIFKGNNKAFGAWRQARLPWLKPATALNFIHVWDRFSTTNLFHNNYGTEICPTILYLLAEPATPDSVVTEVIQRVESGEKMKVKQVQEVIKQAKSNVVQLPSAKVTVTKKTETQKSETVDMMPLLSEMGISKDWVSTYSHVFRHLESLYKNHFAGHDRDAYIASFVQSLPDDQDLSCVYHLSDFLVKLLASLPVKKEL